MRKKLTCIDISKLLELKKDITRRKVFENINYIFLNI